MRVLFAKRALLLAFILVVLGVGVFVFVGLYKGILKTSIQKNESETLHIERKVIGTSVERRAIEAYMLGKGATHVLFVGGIHGGYEWNTVLLAYQFIDYIETNPNVIPENITVTIIPSANPDGLYNVVKKEGRFTISDVSMNQQVLEKGRFNAHNVDLNRNFDCKWKPTSTWRSAVVNAGTKAFSESEAMALRDFVLAYTPDAVVFWHSQANAVYASECENGILPKTLDIMNAYAKASGYGAFTSFDQYEISGDADGWLASISIPAISVELKTHETVEWDQNLAGIAALLKYYSAKNSMSLMSPNVVYW